MAPDILGAAFIYILTRDFNFIYWILDPVVSLISLDEDPYDRRLRNSIFNGFLKWQC
jgi:hypothetical protein